MSDNNEELSLINFIKGDLFLPYSKDRNICIIKAGGLKYIKLWELNRKINLEKVESIYKSIVENIKKYNEPDLLEPLHIAFVIYTNQYELIDGQHRYKSLERLYNEGYTCFEIPIFLHQVKSDSDKVKLFNKINNRLMIQEEDIIDSSIPKILDFIESYWFNKSKKWTPYGINRPRINKEILVKKLKENLSKINKIPFSKIKEYFIERNEYIKNLPRNKRNGGQKANPHNKADEFNFYLGLDKNMKWLNF